MPYATTTTGLAPFQQHLIGTWTNEGVPLGKDGKPLSYNVMPLPQVEPQPGHPCCLGYILKNFAFTEELRFNGTADKDDPHYDPNALAVAAKAPNRGGRYTQDSHVLFYEQQVRFAEGPANGKIVHVENGAWLHLTSVAQQLGPYNDLPAVPGPIVPQEPEIAVAKQIAIPHGNSVLALGYVGPTEKGAPEIPDLAHPYPSPETDESAFPSYDISAYPYYTRLDSNNDFENPNPNLTFNANLALQEAVKLIKPNAYIHWKVDTEPVLKDGKVLGTGVVTNIPFEQRRANVICYAADYWLLSTDGGKSFDYLAYNQIIQLQIPLRGEPYCFPHVTTNTVKRQP